MKKTFALFIVVANFTFAQNGTKLYKDLKEGMSIKLAKKIIKKNRGDYNEVQFGGGVNWTIKTTGLMRKTKGSDYLYGIFMWPKGSMLTGLGYDAARTYLSVAGSFFEEKGYTEIVKNQWWNAPQTFNSGNYLYGYVLLSPEKDRVIHLFPSEVPSLDGKSPPNPTAYLQIYSKDSWDAVVKLNDEKNKKKTKNTDF